MSKLLAGKLAFVTDAGSGIGQEVYQVLNREGAKIVVTDQNIKTAEETVNTSQDLHFSVNYFYRESKLIIGNSAGITQTNDLRTQFNDDEFNDIINVNLKDILLIMQTVLKMMTGECNRRLFDHQCEFDYS